MGKKGIAIATAINAALYFSLPSDMGRLDVLSIIATVYVAAWVIRMPIEDLRKRRQETNDAFEKMRNEKPAFHGIGSPDWPMIEVSQEEARWIG